MTSTVKNHRFSSESSNGSEKKRSLGNLGNVRLGRRIVFRILVSAAAGIGGVNNANAFDTETHALITRQAVEESRLNDPTTLANLGFAGLSSANPFSLYWYSSLVNSIPYYYSGGLVTGPIFGYTAKSPEAFERCQMEEFLLDNVDSRFTQLFSDTVMPPLAGLPVDYTDLDEALPIANWLVRGAIREDDTGIITLGLSYDHCGPSYDNSGTGTYPRSLSHFYDPISNVGLFNVMPPAVNWALGYSDSFQSPQNLLIDTTSINFYTYVNARRMFWKALTSEANKTSHIYGSAERQADAEDRMHFWATTMRSLGDVSHLLEDMAQPQHTRNDAHASFNTIEKQAFEDYTNDRVLGVADEANTYVLSFFHTKPPQFIPLPKINDYPVPMFATPTRYFSTRADDPSQLARSGLADYTNRGFFTAGTMPTMPGGIEPLPVRNLSLYPVVSTPCEGMLYEKNPQLRLTLCDHYTFPVLDNIAGSYVDNLPLYFGQTQSAYTTPPLASKSILSLANDSYGEGDPGGVSIPNAVMGIAELDTTGNLTIPRAVGYATGLINYFFRGELKLSSPPDGLYAVADQGTPHTVIDGVPVLSSDSTTVFGFNTVRVRVQNNTNLDDLGHNTFVDSGTKLPVPQTMAAGHGPDNAANGYFVAIARYHRNSCYRADLSGEYVSSRDANGEPSGALIPSGCALTSARTNIPEISVSAQVWIDASGNLIPTQNPNSDFASTCANVGNVNTGASGSCGGDRGTQAPLLEFDFSADPIPVNATDLFLQVAYRGQLGVETDGIAVAMIDLVEPNYFTQWNNTDWLLYNDVWTKPADLPTPPGPSYFPPAPLTAMWTCFNSQLVATMNEQQQMQPHEFARIAFISDTTMVAMAGQTEVSGEPNTFIGYDGSMPVAQRQADRQNWQPGVQDGGTYAPDPMAYYGRGTTLGFDFGQTYSYFGDSEQDGYIKLLNLTPALGSSSAPGIPLQVRPRFSSAPNAVCQNLFATQQSQAHSTQRRNQGPVTGVQNGGVNIATPRR
jgi:hypothetical protein